MKQFRIDHDTQAFDIIDGVNGLIKPYGLELVDDGKEHDGYIIYHLKESQPTLEKAKELVKGI